jgi:hypothetical protein
LQHAGMSAENANKAIHFSVSFVMGHVSAEFGSLAALSQGIGLEERASIDDPIAADVVAQTRHLSADDRFETGLDLLVAGLRSVYDLP